MTYRGHIRNGVVVLDGAVSLPEGEEVRVEQLGLGPMKTEREAVEAILKRTGPGRDSDPPRTQPPASTLAESLGDFIGIFDDLPPALETVADRIRRATGDEDVLPSDFAANHDHYIHGAPRE